jgi:glucose/arabinose dehydrogenase
MVAFGPDGRLYVGLGDGGSAGDPQHNGQNRANLLGKILRLTVNDAGEVSIPTDNPFASQTGQRGEIWAYGLRNPWRFSFDRKTGDLYIGDVGQSAREEVDVALTVQSLGRGANYGWSIMEGKMCYPSGNGCDQTGLTLPVLEYDHGAGCSITGGYVYRGQALPAIQGRYFYADYCQGWVRSFQYASGGQVLEPQEWPSLAPGGSVTSFGEDAAGELYIMDSNGRVAKFVAAQ